MSYLIHLCHNRHNHIQSVAPPPIIILRCTHLILHHFTCTLYLIVFGSNIIQIGIGLETNLIISKQDIFIRFTIRIFPFRAVVTLGSFPFVVLGPGFRILTICFISGKEICFHITCMICSIIPKRAYFGLIFSLPVLINLIDNFPYLFGLCVFGKGYSRQKPQRKDCNRFEEFIHDIMF